MMQQWEQVVTLTGNQYYKHCLGQGGEMWQNWMKINDFGCFCYTKPLWTSLNPFMTMMCVKFFWMSRDCSVIIKESVYIAIAGEIKPSFFNIQCDKIGSPEQSSLVATLLCNVDWVSFLSMHLHCKWRVQYDQTRCADFMWLYRATVWRPSNSEWMGEKNRQAVSAGWDPAPDIPICTCACCGVTGGVPELKRATIYPLGRKASRRRRRRGQWVHYSV